MTNVNASELSATFTDYDDRSSPYNGIALRLRLSGDVAFLYFGKFTESVDGERFEFAPDVNEASIGVDAELLYQVLGAMLRRGDREAAGRLVEGTLPLDHPSLVSVPGLAGIRRRA